MSGGLGGVTEDRGSHEAGPAAEEVPRRHDRELERRLGVGLGDREFEAVMLPEKKTKMKQIYNKVAHLTEESWSLWQKKQLNFQWRSAQLNGETIVKLSFGIG